MNSQAVVLGQYRTSATDVADMSARDIHTKTCVIYVHDRRSCFAAGCSNAFAAHCGAEHSDDAHVVWSIVWNGIGEEPLCEMTSEQVVAQFPIVFEPFEP